MTKAVKCIGFLGWIFGHKFIKNMGMYTYTCDHCYRCGLPKGRWTA